MIGKQLKRTYTKLKSEIPPEHVSPTSLDVSSDSSNKAEEVVPKNRRETGRIKKRKYSRGGCEECKRRKMKCDEGKPHCHNCSRLNKVCVYRDKQKFRFENADEKTMKGGSSANGSVSHSANESLSNGTGLLASHLLGARSLSQDHHASELSLHSNGSLKTSDPKGFSLRYYNPNGVSANDFSSDLSYDRTNPSIRDSKLGLNGDSHYSAGPSFMDIRSNGGSGYRSENSSPNSIPQSGGAVIAGASQGFPTPTSLQARSFQEQPTDIPRPFNNTIPDILSTSINSSLASSRNEMKHLFDKASLLVNDINDLVALDLSTKDGREVRSSSRPVDPLNGSDSQSTGQSAVSMSDTFEKHDFRLDDLTDQIIGEGRNQYSPVDFNSPRPFDDVKLSDFNSDIANSTLIAQVMQKNKLTDPHLTYLSLLSTTQLSFHMFPFASTIESNQVVRLLLQYSIDCPYLLTSLLAISATFSYNQCGKQVHDLSRKKYISVCLRSLSEVFKGANGPVEIESEYTTKSSHQESLPGNNAYEPHETQLMNDIEKLLLTVLVLTSNFTATAQNDNSKSQMLNSWKVHLRGAKDLLVKYNSLKMSINRYHSSGGLALAKIWFFAMESIASLNSTLGGTLKKKIVNSDVVAGGFEDSLKPEQIKANGIDIDDGLNLPISHLDLVDSDLDIDDNYKVFMDTGYFCRDLNPEYHDTLVKIGLLIPSMHATSVAFNLYLGYSMKIVYLTHEFAKALNFIRSRNGEPIQISTNRIAKLMSMIHEAKRSEIIPGISKYSYLIPKESPGHPDYIGASKISYPSSAYAKYVDKDGEVDYYSWYDLSEQIRIDTLYLRLLTTKGLFNLDRPNALVCELIHKILNTFLVFRRDSPDYESHKSRNDVLVETENFYINKSVFDIRASMVQSAFRLLCNAMQDDLSFEIAECYFLGLVKLGNGSSLGALDLLYKNRDRIRKKKAGEEVTWEQGNDVDNLESIPFA